MINYLWQMLEFFGDPQLSEILFVISLFILPHLLSFLLGLFYKKFRFKMLWLGLWIVLFCALVCGYVFLVYRLRDEAFNSLFSLAMSLAMMLSYIFSFIVCGFFGRAFDTKKIWHRFCVPLVVILPLFIFLLFGWCCIVHPYGEIFDEPLEQDDLAASQGVDYEMFLSEFDAWGDDSKTVSFRERNDSVFFQFTYDMCANTDYDYAERKLKSQLGGAPDGKWTLLDPEKSAVVRKLKKSVEDYSQELSTAAVLDGYASSVVLKDYKRKTLRRLYFPNAIHSHVYDAMTIEKTFESFMPPRETYTTLSYEEAEHKCNELRKASAEESAQKQQKE